MAKKIIVMVGKCSVHGNIGEAVIVIKVEGEKHSCYCLRYVRDLLTEHVGKLEEVNSD